MTSKILSRRDIAFLLHEWLNVESLTSRARYSEHNRETFDAALATAEKVATEYFAPINRLLDTQEPKLVDGEVVTPAELKPALKAYCDAGLLSAGFDEAQGGMQLPFVVERACYAWVAAASVSAAGWPMLTIANAHLLLAHCDAETASRWVPAMLEGRCNGTMCLSEPHVGSSLGDIKTRALPQPDGSYRLHGNKMWISGGEQDLTENIVHLVLAKVPDAHGKLVPGTRGISLFLVPKRLLGEDGRAGERNDIAVAGLNHKMGFRGISNTLLNFGEGRFTPGGQPGAVGHLIGQEGRGLSYMFHMMNEARIGVGLIASVLGYTAYLHALDYARNRPQGRLPTQKDPALPQVPIVQHTDVRRMLLASKSYVEGAMALNLYCAKLVDEQQTAPDAAASDNARRLLELLTPIAKSWASQWCQEANSHAIQVHGGCGYTRDFLVELFYRDQRLNPIHEGTHGIHAMDLLGRKVRAESGAVLRALLAATEQTFSAAREAGGEWAQAADAIRTTQGRIERVIETLHETGDLALTFANAAVFLEAFGHYVLGWIWLEQALCANSALQRGGSALHSDEMAFYKGKLQAARWFMNWELPKVSAMLDGLAALDTTALDMQDAWF
jgi:alkylation response protein AidB-like acyl-CoA dehydrogenase